MKKLNIILTVTFVGIIFFFGCQKMVPTDSSTNTMNAVVDSNIFNSTGTAVSASKIVNNLTITGVTTGNVKLILNVDGFSGFDGRFPLSGTLDSGSGPVSSLIGNIYFTLTFPNLVGTFDFICTDSTYVTHGRFNCVAP